MPIARSRYPGTVLTLLACFCLASGCQKSNPNSPKSVELLNVSYDPTRELYHDLNTAFAVSHEHATGVKVTVRQSHGGSSSQARAVVDGLEADVVTLALWSDVDLLRKKGLIADGWEDRLPNHSLPYTSTVVFVVRKGNPKAIRDWPDLIRPGIEIITPNPKTGGGAKLNFLAAWGSVTVRGGTSDEAEAFVTQLFRQVPVLDSGARAATITFSQKNIGDVHLTWENEAHLEVAESKGKLEIVYPPISILAEPTVAVVDAVVQRKKTGAVAEAYLRFLYEPEAQEIIAQRHYRPIDPEVRRKHVADFPEIELFPVTTIAKDWGDAFEKFFGDGAVFDRIFDTKPPS
ncbi:MAG: sulfate ABC transporter substrate-binding protein [Planctomycetota bacterium]|nr:sulfate ABC transporter substrate-binding protein [Planctomycetota bacterium]